MLKSIFWFWAALCPIVSFCQKNVGDTLDPEFIHQLMQSANPSISESEYRDKAIIIDFWGSQCGTCLKKMPFVLDMQTKFKNDIICLYATEQDSITVRKFFTKRPDIKKYSLPMISDANNLTKTFPHVGIPHIIWIGKDRIVKAITGAEEYTQSNLNMFLTKEINFDVKKDIPDYDADFSLLKNNSIGEDNIISSSTLLGPIPGLPGGNGVRILDSSRVKVYATNSSLPKLYQDFYRLNLLIPSYEVAFRIIRDNVYDSLNFFRKVYCYELIARWNKEERRSIFEWAIKDLDYRFGVKSLVEKKILPCYNFKAPLSAIVTSAEKSFTDEKLDEAIFVNQPLSVVANFIEVYYRPDKLIRVSDNGVKVTLRLPLKPKPFTYIKSELEKNGFSFEVGTTNTEVIMLKEIK